MPNTAATCTITSLAQEELSYSWSTPRKLSLPHGEHTMLQGSRAESPAAGHCSSAWTASFILHSFHIYEYMCMLKFKYNCHMLSVELCASTGAKSYLHPIRRFLARTSFVWSQCVPPSVTVFAYMSANLHNAASFKWAKGKQSGKTYGSTPSTCTVTDN